MKIAVTGGAGYIDSSVFKKLVDDEEEVISVDNLSKGDYGHLRRINVAEKAELVEGDIRDVKLLERMFEGADAVVHLAALPGLVQCREKPEEAISVNIYGTHQVLETVRKLDIDKVVFCSSAATYGRPVEMLVKESHQLRPFNLYGVTKLAGEKLMEVYWDNYGIETISLRFGNVYGVGLFTNYDTVIPRFVRQGLSEEPLTVYGDGNSSRDFVHVEDIVQAINLSLKAKGRGGEVYNVGGETLKIGALAKLVAESLKEATEKPTNIAHLPPRPCETKHFSYDLGKIEKILGYKPGWSVERGVKQVIEYRLRQMEVKG